MYSNSEILAANPNLLSGLDRQRWYVLGIYNQAKPCPSCDAYLRPWEAEGVSVDDYDLSKSSSEHKFKCENCGADIEIFVPLFAVNGFWGWTCLT